MTPIAITMMILFIVVIWGGMIASMVHLARHPDERSGELAKEPGTTNGDLIKLERH